jgi:hypothetical protein
MKRFLIKLFTFLFIPIIIIFFIELYLSLYPLTFQKQASYFKNNLNETGLLVLGSSHNHDAINPEYLNYIKAATLASGSQDLELDYLILKKYIKKLPQLNVVLLELSYHSLEHDIPDDFSQNNLYLRFYYINNFKRDVNLLDYSIFLSNPKQYIKLFNPFKKKNSINKYGIIKDESAFDANIMRFKNLNYNEDKIEATKTDYFITRHKYRSIVTYKKNKTYFDSLLQLCNNNNIMPIIVIPPVHKVYASEMIPEKLQLRDKYLDSIKKALDIQVWNFEKDKTFTVFEFKNDDHLNLKGSERFTKMIQDSLLHLSFKNQFKSN